MRATVKQLRIIVRSNFEAADDGIAPCPETQACLDAKWIVRDVYKMRSGRMSSRWSWTEKGYQEAHRAGLVDSSNRLTTRGLDLIRNCDPEPTIHAEGLERLAAQ